MELKKPNDQDEIYTVGHSNIDFDRFLSLLDGIEILVDARSEPAFGDWRIFISGLFGKRI